MRLGHWVRDSATAFLTSAIALVTVGVQSPSVALASSTQSLSDAKLVASQTTTFPWKGHDPSCKVRLPAAGSVSYGRFTTCPPKRVLVLGDSVALTMGIQMFLDQEDFGTIVDDAGILGCGFVTGYDVEFRSPFFPNKRFVPLNAPCNNEAAVWTSDVRSFQPQAIVTEMGWWDSYRHLINGKVSFLTQPQYDSLVEQRILGLIHSLRSVTGAPIYFLSVPWMQPAALQNGQPEPAASTASHNEINSLIRLAAQSSTTTHFVDISRYITPAGHFQADVGGGICRTSDGIHLYNGSGKSHSVHTECGKALQRGVLSMIRQDLLTK
jgi:hypothetical protein